MLVGSSENTVSDGVVDGSNDHIILDGRLGEFSETDASIDVLPTALVGSLENTMPDGVVDGSYDHIMLDGRIVKFPEAGASIDMLPTALPGSGSPVVPIVGGVASGGFVERALNATASHPSCISSTKEATTRPDCVRNISATPSKNARFVHESTPSSKEKVVLIESTMSETAKMSKSCAGSAEMNPPDSALSIPV